MPVEKPKGILIHGYKMAGDLQHQFAIASVIKDKMYLAALTTICKADVVNGDQLAIMTLLRQRQASAEMP